MQIISNKYNSANPLAQFINDNYGKGYFLRTFVMDGSTMFYLFDKPNRQGFGMAFISDRYPQGYLDEQTALNDSFIPKMNYIFPRVYYIRDNRINILSGENDLTDRKEFQQTGDTAKQMHLEKIFTYRKDNNDIIYDHSYHIDYIDYESAITKWKNKFNDSVNTKDASVFLSDINNYTEFDFLKKIIRTNSEQKDFLLNYIDTASNISECCQWFFAGTINEFNMWENNFTDFDSLPKIDEAIKNNKTCKINSKIYLRNSPPSLKTDTSKANVKGKIKGSLSPDDEVYVIEKTCIPFDKKWYVWLKKNPF